MLYFLDQITKRKVFSCFSLYAWRNFWNSHGHSLWILMPIAIVSRLPIFISLSPSRPHILLPNQPRSFPSGSDTLVHCFQISHGHWPQYTLLPDQPCYAPQFLISNMHGILSSWPLWWQESSGNSLLVTRLHSLCMFGTWDLIQWVRTHKMEGFQQQQSIDFNSIEL